MAETIRLNKVLRELNISLDRAVEFLDSKGIEIEKRPTTKISEETFAILSDEFQTDANKKMASKEVNEAKNKEKEALRIKREKELEEKQKADEAKAAQLEKEEVIKASKALSGPKTVGKIDLDADKKAKKPVAKKEEPKAKVEKAPKAEVKPAKAETPKAETKTKAKLAAKKEEEVIPEEPVEKTLETKYTKLSGPKIAGDKIDLSQFNKPKKKKEDPKKDDNANKKKRRRISKPGDNKPGAGGNANRRGGNDRFKGKKPGGGRKNIVKEEPSEEDVKRQVRETLEKLQGSRNSNKSSVI